MFRWMAWRVWNTIRRRATREDPLSPEFFCSFARAARGQFWIMRRVWKQQEDCIGGLASLLCFSFLFIALLQTRFSKMGGKFDWIE